MSRKSTPLAPLDPRQRYSIDEACGYLRISRDYLYNLIREGAIRTIRDGRRQFVPGIEIAQRSALPR
jgi:excisionase family DNA binding protein